MSPFKMSKIESAMRTVLALVQNINQQDIDAMLGLMAEDCVCEIANPAPDGTAYRGKDEVKQYWQEFFRVVPDAHTKVEEIFSLGERCVMRWKCTWSDEDGGEVYLRGADIFLVRDGLIHQQLSYIKG